MIHKAIMLLLRGCWVTITSVALIVGLSFGIVFFITGGVVMILIAHEVGLSPWWGAFGPVVWLMCAGAAYDH